MRKLNSFARRSIGIFGFTSLLSTSLVAGSAVKVIASQEEQYPVQDGTIIFDNTYTGMEVQHAGYVRKSWNSEYTLDSGGRTYALGEKTVGYSPTSNQVEVYGGGYLLNEDGTVNTLKRYYEADNLNHTSFIKLDDNKFLICGDSITTGDGNLETEKYVYVVMDKAGNARIMNHLINVKVLGDTTISTGNLTLDLNEQTLEFAGNYLDLEWVKNYMGSGGEVYDLFVRGGNGGDTGLGGERGRTGVGDLVLSVERSVQEQLGVLSHDTDVSGGGVDGVGAGAGAGNNGDLGHNTGHARNLSGQAGVGVEQVKAALQLSAGGVIERNDRCTGLGGHLQHADILFNILHADGRTVLKHDVGVLAVCTAVSCTYSAVSKQRRVGAVIKKCCKDLCLAGLICCHTVSSYGKADCFL